LHRINSNILFIELAILTRKFNLNSMSAVKRNAQASNEREFIGKAWINEVTKEGPHKGVEYVNVTLDQDIDKVEMLKGSKLLLWPNEKREGKQDADYRVSLIQPTA